MGEVDDVSNESLLYPRPERRLSYKHHREYCKRIIHALIGVVKPTEKSCAGHNRQGER
ncbi:hypothetical protein SCLCIDRAFT_237659 [Scleroderma citrinum Foug A]|uniref:Uncharacterized protein n=1 Tax=Scleroderma citrinum Foug A TaxID=1036808 RepID=A0A0C3DKH8_9AGAM|nr:hypothetical protein SCLCIDRAFT_237659 [Scleroderma citrinum Foug A]